MDEDYADFEVEASTPLLPEQQTGEMPSSDLQPRPSSRRKRATQLGLLLGALLVVGIILHSLIPSATSTTVEVGEVTVQQTDATLVAIQSNVNFGTVTINGTLQRGSLPILFAPARRMYAITIYAPPFQPNSCLFDFSNEDPQTGDIGTCTIASGNLSPITANGVTGQPDYSVELDFQAESLPLDQQNQINTLLAQSLTDQQTTTVPAGSHFVTAFDADTYALTSQQTPTAIQGTASLAASTDFGSAGHPDCTGLICQADGGSLAFYQLGGSVWMIAVPVVLRWRFTTSAGQALSDVSFPVAALLGVALTYDPTTGWNVSPQSAALDPMEPEDVDCQTGLQVMQQLRSASFGYSAQAEASLQGCLIDTLDNTGDNAGTFIWRFGVLLAADAAAHALLPGLPVASQAEIDAVTPG